MKRFINSYWSLFVVASLLIATSCGTDDETVSPNRPTISISGIDNQTATDVMPGEEVSFNVNVNAPAGFNTLYINKTGGTPMAEQVISRGTALEQNFVHQFSYTPTMEEAGERIVFDFQAVDDNDQDNVLSYTINVGQPPLVSWEDELLFAPLGDGSSQTWFSTSTGSSYSSNQVNTTALNLSNLIDFGYFYGVTRQATLASPANFPIATAGQATWNTRNATQLKKTNLPASAFFEANTANTIQQAFENATFGTSEEQATNLQIGDVIAFRTDPDRPGGGRYGLIHVSTITGTTGTDGSIRINVKVMP